MDIVAVDGNFAVAAMGMSKEYGFDTRWNTPEGTLTVWVGRHSKRKDVHVSTNQGIFLEAVDESGKVIVSGGDGDWFYVPLGKKPITLRYKVLPKVKLSKPELDKHRQTITRYLVSDSPYSLEIPDTLVGVIKWLEKQAKAIPEASRAKASFRFATTTEYGETYPNIEITYDEPETDKELISRLQIESEREHRKEENARQQFEVLKTRFASTT